MAEHGSASDAEIHPEDSISNVNGYEAIANHMDSQRRMDSRIRSTDSRIRPMDSRPRKDSGTYKESRRLPKYSEGGAVKIPNGGDPDPSDSSNNDDNYHKPNLVKQPEDIQYQEEEDA